MSSAPTLARLHLVTDDEVLRRPETMHVLEELAARSGPRLRVHVRAPRSPGAFVAEWVAAASDRVADSGTRLSVNDRVAIAAAFGADVHLGQRSLTVAQARRVAPHALVGVSCHDEAEVDTAVAAGADYLFVGPAFETASHPGATPLGAAGFARLVQRAARLPVVAVGGIDPDRIPSLLDAGASGVAAIRGIWNAPDSPDALARYISALDLT
ncbi:MAG: thiamine phosphate synthase [Gemmatimonadota bacterium]